MALITSDCINDSDHLRSTWLARGGRQREPAHPEDLPAADKCWVGERISYLFPVRRFLSD